MLQLKIKYCMLFAAIAVAVYKFNSLKGVNKAYETSTIDGATVANRSHGLGIT